MALTTTTLASACGINDTVIVVAASTGFTAGYQIIVDQEVMQIVNSYTIAGNGVNVPVLRAQNGTVTQAHAASANVTMGAQSDTDWGSYAPQSDTAFPIAGRATTLTSYSATGAISLPNVGNNAIAVLNGTGALAMTLAVPTKDQDGSILTVIGNGKAAHTVTFATAIGNSGAGYTVLTFPAGGQVGFQVMACNGIWVILSSPISGTSTNITLAIS